MKPKNSATRQTGFTLIELMIVVAIIGILAAIAVPAYQNYTIRAQVTEGLSLADGWKTAVSEYYQSNGSFPSNYTTSTSGVAGNIVVTGASSGKYVTGIAVSTGGAITISYGNQANPKLSGLKLSLNPGVSANLDIIWDAGHASTAPGTISALVRATDAALGV